MGDDRRSDERWCPAAWVVCVDAVMWVMLGVGGVVGFFVGRIWAEVRRARHDMNVIWNGRRRYRGG